MSKKSAPFEYVEIVKPKTEAEAKAEAMDLTTWSVLGQRLRERSPRIFAKLLRELRAKAVCS